MPVSKSQDIPVETVGSSTFGLYPKISLSKTYNMYISDNWMVNYPGFKKKASILPDGEGRGLFNSTRGGFMIAVISDTVYRINSNFVPVIIGTIGTFTGDVSIDENLAHQICIVDGKNAYIYNYISNTFTLQTLTYTTLLGSFVLFPGYVSYHNTFFLFGSSPTSQNSQFWFAYERDTDSTIKVNTVFSISTKPDTALLVERLPGKGNNVLVLGSTVGEVWTQVGGTQNYVRIQSFNIDYGIVSVSTLASNEDQVCWLAQNENNSPTIMITDGGSSKRLSTDGIDHVLDQIQFPQQSNAFFFRQDGHLFYQLTFYNPADNLTLIHDFTTGLFFHVSDQNLNYHPARQLAFFNDKSYFTSINDGELYLMDGTLVTYDYNIAADSVGEEIPRIRICKSIGQANSDPFRVGKFTFWLQQGVNNYYISNPIIPRVDMSFSKNGGESFSNIVGFPVNAAAHYKNVIRSYRWGQCNEIIIQLRFIGMQRFVVGPGVLSYY